MAQCFILIGGADPNLIRQLLGRFFSSTTSAEWTKPSSFLTQEVRKKFPSATIIPFPWSGAHSGVARAEAAKSLASKLNEMRQRYDQIVLVGHSHGGNIALQAAYRAPLAMWPL